MQILVILGMYFDAVVVFVNSQTHSFRLALAILCNMNDRNVKAVFSYLENPSVLVNNKQ